MRGLYKNRYLIAIYDSNDNLVDCATRVADLRIFNPKGIYHKISINDFKTRGHTIHLIDCLERHNDIFSEEDDIFLEETKKQSIEYNLQQQAKQLGISLRTAYRLKKKGKLEDIENVI